MPRSRSPYTRATAARLVNSYGPIEEFPDSVLGERKELALLFKNLATLRREEPLFQSLDSLRWSGSTPELAAYAQHPGGPRLLERCRRVEEKVLGRVDSGEARSTC